KYPSDHKVQRAGAAHLRFGLPVPEFQERARRVLDNRDLKFNLSHLPQNNCRKRSGQAGASA
ncbi:MAG: hypothetical protein LW697_14460, partial [Blastopirellula sp.]|nr:hypothetical protein [Blastopirellula sp.]